jgi:cell division protein FtsQ
VSDEQATKERKAPKARKATKEPKAPKGPREPKARSSRRARGALAGGANTESTTRRWRPTTDPRIHARRVEVAREHGRRRLRRVFIAIALVALVAGGLTTLHSSWLGARHIRITGAANISRESIIAIAGLTGSPPLIDIDTGKIADRVEKLPWVGGVEVSLQWPTTVDIAIKERIPVATIAEPGAGRLWAVTDQFGRVLEEVSSRPPSLPLIGEPTGSGAAGQPYLPGAYLPEALRELAIVAAAMPQSMVPKVDLVTVSPDGVVLEMPGHPLAIVGDTTSLAQKFVSLATVLARADLTGVGAIDLRVPAAPVLLDKQSSPIVAGHVGG